jgi:RNA polymerase sigma-70 factor (ECF subfamily)
MLDESTFESFYEHTKRSLWLYLSRTMKDDALADDFFQEAYIRLLQRPAVYKDDARMKSYLFRIATNLMHDHWRKTKREHKRLETETKPHAAIAKGNEIDRRLDIGEAFHRLSPQQRSLLWLAYAEEYEHKEIAEILKVGEKSVKVMLFRAKQKLSGIFKQLGITPETVS